MRPMARCGASLALLALALAGPAFPSHTTFSSSCDRFTADGNAFGPFDGASDFVDDFGGGGFAPNWELFYGTAVETGGAAVFQSPGSDFLIGSTTFDLSNVENTVEVANGAGDLVATSSWLALPALDREFHMQLYDAAGLPIEVTGIRVSNLSPEAAALEGGGALAGHSISQQVLLLLAGSPIQLQFDAVSIDPGNVTGQIVLRFALDDAANRLTCSFSLDGGTVFQSPFPPMPVFNVRSTYELLLGAGAEPPPEPPITWRTVGFHRFQLTNPSAPSARKLVYDVKLSGYPGSPGEDFGHPQADGATLNVAVDGATQCFALPASGWRNVGGSGWKYRDPRGENGPVRSALIKVNGLTSSDPAKRVFVSKATISGQLGPLALVPPNPGVHAETRFHFGGAQGKDVCGSTVGGEITRNDARAFSVRESPAPPECSIPACSPNGAFLDTD